MPDVDAAICIYAVEGSILLSHAQSHRALLLEHLAIAEESEPGQEEADVISCAPRCPSYRRLMVNALDDDGDKSRYRGLPTRSEGRTPVNASRARYGDHHLRPSIAKLSPSPHPCPLPRHKTS